MIGAGLVLHGQVALARYMREEVDHTFFLWRALGHATFAFQGGETRMALAMAEVPEEALRHSNRAAWVLVIVGGLVSLTGPLLRRGHPVHLPGVTPKVKHRAAGKAPRSR